MRTNTSTIVFIGITTLFITGQAAPAVGAFAYVNRSDAICPTLNVSIAASVETAAARLPQSRRDDMRTGFPTVGTLSQASARTSVQKSLKCKGTSIDEAVQAVQTSTATATVCDLNGQIISQEECDEGIATGRFVEDDGEPPAVDTSYRLIRQLTTATTHLHKGRTFAPPKREATAYSVTAYAYS